jgi:hypothetical protein
MATKVVVKQFGGPEVGVIRYGIQGELTVSATQPELQAELEGLVKALTERPLTAVSGRVVVKDGQEIHETISRPVVQGEPRYLLALADAITQSGRTIAGKRVRAFVHTEG